MKTVVLTLLCLLLPIGLHAAKDTYPPVKPSKSYQWNSKLTTYEYHLNNGLSVFLTPNPKAPSVWVYHWVKAGSLNEKPGITGIAHLFEHMMFRPLAVGEKSFGEKVADLSADYNANTRFESTVYLSNVPSKNLEKLLFMESERFRKLTVTDELLNIERKAVESEYATKMDSQPIIHLLWQMYQQGYKGHPFGWSIMGNREDLYKITAKDCNAFFNAYYKPNNIGLFISGNFKKESVIRMIQRNYGDWEKGESSVLPATDTAIRKETIGNGKLPSLSPILLWGMRTPYFSAHNIKAISLFSYIFFESNNSLSDLRLKINTHVINSISSIGLGYYNGVVMALLKPTPSVSAEAIRNEFKKLKQDFSEMSDETFNAYRKNHYTGQAESMQRNQSITEFLAQSWGKFGDISLFEDFTSKPLLITKAELEAFINDYFKADNFIWIATPPAPSPSRPSKS